MGTWSFRDLDRVAAADLLHPDVEFSAAIGAVSNEAPIRRPRGSNLQAVVKRDASEFAASATRAHAVPCRQEVLHRPATSMRRTEVTRPESATVVAQRHRSS